MNILHIVIGVFLVALSLTVYQKIRSLRLLAILTMLVGGVVTVAGFRGDLMDVIIPFRMRISMLLVAFIILYVTLEAVRRNALKERYALLWIATGAIFFAFGLNPDLIATLVAISGMHYISTIVVLVFTFLILLAFHVSLALSRTDDDRRRTAQTIALLEERIRQLEKSSGQSGPNQVGGHDRKPEA